MSIILSSETMTREFFTMNHMRLEEDKPSSSYLGEACVDASTHSSTSTASMTSHGSATDADCFVENCSLSHFEELEQFAHTTLFSAPTQKSKKRVRFGSLQVHEYGIELGGSGVPRMGPPTALSWERQRYFMIDSVELYEDTRPCIPRKGTELLLPESRRIEMLLTAGHTMRQIKECTKENEIILRSRGRTLKKFGRPVLVRKISTIFKRKQSCGGVAVVKSTRSETCIF